MILTKEVKINVARTTNDTYHFDSPDIPGFTIRVDYINTMIYDEIDIRLRPHFNVTTSKGCERLVETDKLKDIITKLFQQQYELMEAKKEQDTDL